MADIRLIRVEPELVARIWPYVSDVLRTAMRRGGIDGFAPVQSAVLAGRLQLWLAVDQVAIHGAAVTALHHTETKKVCIIVALGGYQMRQWLHLLAGLEQYAKDEGCSGMRVLGRKGWRRILKDYRERHIVLEKDL